MKTIWKQEIEPGKTEISLPKGSAVLTIQLDKKTERPTIWFLVPDTEAPKETRYFRIYGTGHAVDERLKLQYIGTFQMGPFVFHLFEVPV